MSNDTMKTALSVPSDALALLELNLGWQAWVASRPPHIQAAIRRFPPGTTGELLGERVWLLGYGEIVPPVGVEPSLDHVMLLFSTVCPFDEDYDRAREPQHIRRACAAHFVPEQVAE
jgi:hypothetical protein